MMPVIRITDATWDRLKRWAIPLEDTPEDAVRKVLDAAEENLKYPKISISNQRTEVSKQSKIQKLRKGQKTPQQEYRIPILEALYELGGSAPVSDVLNIIEKKMKAILNEYDYQKLPSGVDIRWRNTAMWERYNLVKDGLLKSDSQDGTWELSSEGAREIGKA